MTKDTPIVETEWKEETPTVETEWTDVEVVKKKDNADSKLEIGSKVSTSSVGQSKSTSESSTVNKPTYDVSKLTNIPGLNTQKTQQLDLTRPAQKKTISQKEPLLKPTQKELVTGDYIIKDDRPKNIEKIQSALGKGTPVVEQKQTIKVEENPYKVDITDKSSENTSTKNQVAKRSILEDATALNTLSSDELINVDETTANDFLVSSGVKNKDREQYISEQAQSNPKYGYDYEYNKIGSLYKAVKQRADDYDVVLKEKFGDNYFELAKQGDVNVVNDEDFNKFAQLREKQNQLSTKANGLINEDKYKEVKDYNIQKEKKQAEADAIAKKDTWYNPKDELKYIDSKVAQTLGKVVKMVAEIPALATSIDKGYDWTDKLADWGDRYANAVIDDVPVSSDFKGSFSNDVANVDGYKVIVDENKNVIDVRDKNNFKVPASVSQPLIEKYSANPANYKIKNEKSYRSLVDNGLNTVLDMGVMILGTKGAGMLGAAEKLQKLTSIGIAYQQTKRDVFNDAIKKGLDPRKADELSNIIAIAAGTSNLINPMEYNIASGKGLFSFIKKEGLDASKIALINEGKLGIKDYAKQFVKSGLKNTVGENIEELGIENTTQAIANNAFNKSISAEDRTDGGLDDKLHIFDKQGLETFLITSGAAMLMTPIEMKSQTTFNQQEALKMAMEKPDDFAKIRQMQVANGTITPQQFESEKKILEEVSQTYNASKDDIKEELQPQLIALLVKKYNLTNKINEIKDEALASPYKVILEKVNAGIQDIAGGKSASPELVETVEENINPATGMVVEQTDTKVPVVNTTIGTATAKDGSDIITQTKVAISNKNAKGEPLTGEEQDFYNNYKEEIDGLASKVESSNEVKITDEKYKDIPSQKIEYKDGTAFVHKDKEGNKEHLFISRMDVSNKGKGTGSEMLKKVEEHALKIELDQVVTIPETDASRKFFEKNGYTYSDGILTKDLKQKTNKDEIKTTSTESVDTGQKQDNITGVQQNEQNGGTIQQGNGQNESDQKEVQVTAEEKINPLESKFKKKIPTEKVEETVDEIVTPIRQLGTGANVYFETPKYRVNETKDGKVLLNINGEEDGGMAIANIEFDNVNEAVKVAERLQQDFPNGIPDDIRAEKYVEATREDLNKENINATPEVSKPVSEVADNTEQQGVKEAVSKSVDATGQGNAEVAVADVKTPISKTETTEKQNKVVASDNTKNKKKDYEMSSSEYEKERQISVPVFKRAKIIAIRILDWSGTGGLYEKYINSKGIKPNINGVYENTDISNIEDYMKFLLKEKADFFTREDYETYLKYKDFMDRGIDPDWNNHETRVSSALYENKEVPKSVLSEYPNLENKESGIAEITPNKNVSASKASAIKDLLADKYSDLKEMEAGVLANLDGTESIDDLMEYVDWNRTTQKGGVYKGKGLKGSNIVKLIEKGYVEELSFMDENITLTDKGKKFQEALKARQETRKGIKEGTDLFPKDAGLSGKELIGDALDRIVDKIGGKKNLTEQEKTTLTKDITDLAKGLLQEGKATIDNIIDKIIDAIKKRLPDLDEKDVKDLADTVNDKVIFSEGVKWYKDNGYTYEQTKKRLDEINADYTEQELKDAWDGEKKEKLDDSKQRVADRFVKGNNSFEDAKNMVIENGYDKGDYDSKQIIKDIDNLIKKTGIENIEQLLDLPLSEPHRVVLQSKLIEHFGNQSTDESLSAEQREEAFEKSARYLLDLSRERTDSGRGNAILNQIYMDTDIYFTLPMMMKKMDALGTILSDTEMAEIKEMAKEIEQLREENKKLQELAKKEEEQNIIDDITTHLLVDELIIDSKIKEDEEIKKAKNVLAKGFQDIARMLGGIKMVTQEEKVKFTETILDMTKATMTISKIGVKRALKAVIKSIRSANPNIDENLIKDAEQHVLNNIKETDTGIKKKDGTGISKDELLALVEGGADTMDKLIVAIRDKYHDGDKNVTDKQIRDEITNYGKSTRESRTDIEKKLTEIKSVMLLQSKLEDAENNIAPKKTGLIRDKATMPVREKRRELAEAMKKLTVTLTEDDIAGLNERKLTQLANRIEEVQNVLKGIQKPNKQGVFEYSDEVKKKQKELDDLMNDQKVLLHYAKEKLNNLLAKYQDRLDKKQYAKNPTINKLTLTDKEYVDLKAKLEAKKEELKKKRNDFRNNDADYLLNTKQKQIDRQIAELDNLLSGINQRKTSEQLKAERDRKAGIINTSTNTTALQKLKDNQAKLEAKKEEWEKKVIQKEIEEEKKKRTWLDKLGVFYEEVKATSRLATLGLIDIGWVGVQGGYFLRTKPITTLKSLKNAWDSGGLSEKEFDAWRKELKNNPFYETMLKAGLDIPNQSLRQDLWQQEFRPSTVSNFLDKVPILNIPNKNGRLSLKFLTNLRIKAFNDLYNGLTATQKTDPEILEKLADFVNSRSGAGRVIGEDKNRGLNKHWNFMTSVRNTSSMLQQTYIGMLYGLYKNYDSKSGFSINPKTAMAKQPIVYRQITHDLQNQIVLWGTVYLAYLLANINDKDKEDDWNVELSPFSTDFGKLKNKSGNRSYFDIGGTTALNVASLRLLFTVTNGLGLSDVQNYKNYKGEYSQLNAQGWGGKKGIDIAASAFLNRTLSFYSPIKTPLIAEKNKDGNYNIFGQNYTPSEYKWKIIKDMVFPMNIPAVWNDYKDKDVNAGINVLDFILSGTGISYNNQIYDSKQPSQNTQKAPSVNSLGAPLQKPKKKESIFKNMFNKNP